MEANIETYNDIPPYEFSINQAEGDLAYLKDFGKLPEEFVYPSQTVEPDLSGANPTERGEHPWVVLIQSSRGTGMGTLINDEWVLTCGHCVDWGNVPPQGIKLSLGGIQKNELEDGEVVVRAVKVIPFDPINKEDDIALIKIPKITETEYIRPLNIYTDTVHPQLGEIMTSTLVGWGQTETGETSPILEDATAQFLCRNYEGSRIKCQDPYNPEIGICPGNSGSPLEFAGTLYAVGVGGNSCDEERRFSEFLRTEYYKDRIEKIIADNQTKEIYMPEIKNERPDTYLPFIEN